MEKKYEKLLDEWQERLGLQDWLIWLRYGCKPEDFDGERDGECRFTSESKQAHIRIIDENLYSGMLDYDFEYILVHELLHIKFNLLECGSQLYEGVVTEALRHQILDDLARALVMAKRGETKRQLGKDVKRIINYEVK